MPRHPLGRPLVAAVSTLVLLGACSADDADTASPNGTEPTSSIASEGGASTDPATTDDGPNPAMAGASGVEGPTPAPLGDAVFLPTRCPFETEVDLEVQCGVVEVPESRTGRGEDTTATIELAVAILRTPSPDPADDPVVHLAGGPGGVALAEHFVWYGGTDDWHDHPVFAHRDMILVDQRGTGYSRPSLWCDDESEDVAGCHDRLVERGIDLTSYSTPENAADIATVRQALGIDEWNLYGSSYGTRLALTILRDHPDGVRSVVLEGVYPPEVVPAYHEYLPHTVQALDTVVAACAAQPACDEAYGDVERLLVEALAAADDDTTSSRHDSVDLVDALFGSLYTMDGVLDVPYLLSIAAAGDVDLVIDGLTDAGEGARPGRSGHRSGGDPTEDSAGLFHSIECREEHAFTDLDHIRLQADMYRSAGLDERLVDAMVDAVEYPVEHVCTVWDSGVADDAERAPATSDVPVLLLSGQFDPITPAEWGDVAAASLPNAVHVVAPGLSHSLVLEDPCIDAITRDFLVTPEVAPDTSCIESVMVPAFTLPE